MVVNVNSAPFSSRNTALAHSARHDAVACMDNAQRRCALSGETPCKKLSTMLRSMFLELSSQSASSTVSAARCPAVCQDMTSHVLTTSQLQSSSYASSRHQSSCYDQRRRHLARQGPVCNVAITMSASSIAQRQTCCQATASWFVDEYGT